MRIHINRLAVVALSLLFVLAAASVSYARPGRDHHNNGHHYGWYKHHGRSEWGHSRWERGQGERTQWWDNGSGNRNRDFRHERSDRWNHHARADFSRGAGSYNHHGRAASAVNYRNHGHVYSRANYARQNMTHARYASNHTSGTRGRRRG